MPSTALCGSIIIIITNFLVYIDNNLNSLSREFRNVTPFSIYKVLVHRLSTVSTASAGPSRLYVVHKITPFFNVFFIGVRY